MRAYGYNYDVDAGQDDDYDVNDDLYTGFNDSGSKPDGVPGGAARLGTAQLASDDVRPMTSVKGAGYRSGGGGGGGGERLFDPMGRQAAAASTPTPLQQQQNNAEQGAEFVARQLEKEVNALIEQSAAANSDKDYVRALNEAKLAIKKEKAMLRHAERFGLNDQLNLDLSFAVHFNLAVQYHVNKMHSEALNTYSMLVKRKEYAHAGRLRVNMGNIFYEQNNYQAAIKMYRMAMDQIGNTSKETRYKIMRNIANAFVRLGQFQDAIQSFESIMDACPNSQTGFNLIVCYYARGDKDKMKKCFLQLLTTPILDSVQELDTSTAAGAADAADAAAASAASDPLSVYLRQRQGLHARYVLLSAKLIAPVLEDAFDEGYDWVTEHLRSLKNSLETGDGAAQQQQQQQQQLDYSRIAMELEICKGVAFLKQQKFERAIEVLRNIERKGTELHEQAANNLSFLYFLEGNLTNAKKFAELALRENRYNADALVNRSNVFVAEGELDNAQQMFLEAIGVDADCTEAIFNLGLVSKRANALEESMQAFRKLHRIVPKSPTVIYQIADLHERMGEVEQAVEWLKIVQSLVPGDPHVLSRLGNLASNLGQQTQAFHYFMESYQLYPVNMDVISWLGVWYVKGELYENAIEFFERAAEIEPKELKWKLMVASCHRRMSHFQPALDLYKRIHQQDPDSIECLRYLVSLCKELGDRSYEEFAKRLERLERVVDASKDAHSNSSRKIEHLEQRRMKARVTAASAAALSVPATDKEPGQKQEVDALPSSKQHESLATTNHRMAPEAEDEWDGVELDDELLPM